MKIFFLILLIFFGINLAFSECPNGGIPTRSNTTLCYIFNSTASTFIEAEEQCNTIGGHLTSIQDMFDNMFLSNEAEKIFTNVTNSDFWFGANDLSSQGIWGWMDGTSFLFKDWDKGQPQSSLDNGCGAVIIQGAKWISDNCFKQKPFVCTVPTLPNIKSTTTPAAPQTLCSEGWTYFNYTGFCYKVLVTRMTWEAAEKACIAEGSHLISIHSWREIIFATDLASPYSSNGCDWHDQTWIGFYTKDAWMNYQWSDGTSFDYKSWGPREPNGPEGLNNCGNIWTGIPCIGTDWVPAELYDYWCDNSMETSICKKLPYP